MRKQVFGRQFKRDVNERKALFKGLLSSLVLRGRITTTEEKAKAIKASADRLITTARKGELLARNLLGTSLSPVATAALLGNVLPRYDGRVSGGYTRIIKIGKRLSDNAPLAMLEWVVPIMKNGELRIKNAKQKLGTEVQAVAQLEAPKNRRAGKTKKVTVKKETKTKKAKEKTK